MCNWKISELTFEYFVCIYDSYILMVALFKSNQHKLFLKFSNWRNEETVLYLGIDGIL